MSKIFLCGEPMVLFQAETEGDFHSTTLFSKHIVGAELNVAIGLRRLEHEVLFQTKLGDDLFGHDIAEFLMDEQVGASLSFQDSAYTGYQVKNKVLNGDPVVTYYRKGSAASSLSIQDIKHIQFDEYDWIHVTGVFPAISKSCEEVALYLVREAKKKGIGISFDPNIRAELWENEQRMISILNEIASLSDVCLPGLEEGRLLSGQSDLEDICDFYLSLGAKTVIVKDGATGSLTKTAETKFYTFSENVDKIIDTVGAGDGFAVGIISGILEGLTIQDTVKRASVIGALQIEKLGDNDGLPNRNELAKRLSDEED